MRPGLLLVLVLAVGAASAGEEVEYFQPFQYGEIQRVTCANGHGTHLDGGNQFAIDYGMRMGTPVVAAAAGEVIAVEQRFEGPSSDAARTNQIALRHANGQVTVYLHLRKGGAVVRKGQRVLRGDLIGYSGNSGRSSGPHLHFGVQKRLGGASVSFRFADFGGSGVPNYLDRVTSFNFPVRFEKEYDAITTAVREAELAERLGCWETVERALHEARSLEMPMPLRALIAALRARDAAWKRYEQAAAAALAAIEKAPDLAAALRAAAHGYGRSRSAAALRKAASALQKKPGYDAAFRSLEGERRYRRLLVTAVRAESAARRRQNGALVDMSILDRYRAALGAAPARERLRVESHLAALESGLRPSTVAYYQPWEFRDIRRVRRRGSSDPAERFSFDYAMPAGTPVLASAGGVVVAVSTETAGWTGDAAEANFVAVRHADGSVTIYRYLAFRGAAVQKAQELRRGDLVGFTGVSGDADRKDPFLRFGRYRDVGGASAPIRFADFGGSGVPNAGDLVTSFNFPERCIETNREIRDMVALYALCRRFGCLEFVAAKLAACDRIVYTMPLRSLQEVIRSRDAVRADYEAAAAESWRALRAATGSEAVRRATLGARDFAASPTAPRFAERLALLKTLEGYAAAAKGLAAERSYRATIERALVAEMDESADRDELRRLYQLALRLAPPERRDAIARHIAALR